MITPYTHTLILNQNEWREIEEKKKRNKLCTQAYYKHPPKHNPLSKVQDENKSIKKTRYQEHPNVKTQAPFLAKTRDQEKNNEKKEGKKKSQV